jgi:hypothetical protein
MLVRVVGVEPELVLLGAATAGFAAGTGAFVAGFAPGFLAGAALEVEVEVEVDVGLGCVVVEDWATAGLAATARPQHAATTAVNTRRFIARTALPS